MTRIPTLAIALLFLLSIALAPALPAQDPEHPGEDVAHEEADGHDTNETYEEYHDPWMNLYVTGGVIIAFMVAVVVWPRK